MIIGTDELILWLRKNNKAINLSNEILGRKIRVLMKDNFNVDPTNKDVPSYWASENGDRNIDAKQLPKTSAQYEIDFDNLDKIYSIIEKW